MRPRHHRFRHVHTGAVQPDGNAGRPHVRDHGLQLDLRTCTRHSRMLFGISRVVCVGACKIRPVRWLRRLPSTSHHLRRCVALLHRLGISTIWVKTKATSHAPKGHAPSSANGGAAKRKSSENAPAINQGARAWRATLCRWCTNNPHLGLGYDGRAQDTGVAERRRTRRASRFQFARVAPGDFSPRAPTDPDVQYDRIRLFESGVCCPGVDAVHDPRWGSGYRASSARKRAHVRRALCERRPATCARRS